MIIVKSYVNSKFINIAKAILIRLTSTSAVHFIKLKAVHLHSLQAVVQFIELTQSLISKLDLKVILILPTVNLLVDDCNKNKFYYKAKVKIKPINRRYSTNAFDNASNNKIYPLFRVNGDRLNVLVLQLKIICKLVSKHAWMFDDDLVKLVTVVKVGSELRTLGGSSSACGMVIHKYIEMNECDYEELAKFSMSKIKFSQEHYGNTNQCEFFDAIYHNSSIYITTSKYNTWANCKVLEKEYNQQLENN